MTKRTALATSIKDFDPDLFDRPAVALRLRVEQNNVEQPVHQHRKGQLIMTVHGAVTCEIPNSVWVVPPQHAVWIPPGIPHSNRATDNAQIYFLFVDSEGTGLPEQCCTLNISPLVREMIFYLAEQDPRYPREGAIARLAEVLIEQLSQATIEQLTVPISNHPHIRLIAHALVDDPANRMTQAQWANTLAMSERTLARLIKRETGLTFGRWRQQLQLVIALQQLAVGTAVQTVAGNLGYDSVTAFITMFKKALGSSPSHYFDNK